MSIRDYSICADGHRIDPTEWPTCRECDERLVRFEEQLRAANIAMDEDMASAADSHISPRIMGGIIDSHSDMECRSCGERWREPMRGRDDGRLRLHNYLRGIRHCPDAQPDEPIPFAMRRQITQWIREAQAV